MARTMKKFSAGGAQGKYDRRMADIEKDYQNAMKRKTGRAAEVAAAKRDQRKADAEDDRAKRMGLDRTKTREAERNAEYNLTRTRRSGAAMPAVTKDELIAPGKMTESLGAITAPKSGLATAAKKPVVKKTPVKAAATTPKRMGDQGFSDKKKDMATTGQGVPTHYRYVRGGSRSGAAADGTAAKRLENKGLKTGDTKSSTTSTTSTSTGARDNTAAGRRQRMGAVFSALNPFSSKEDRATAYEDKLRASGQLAKGGKIMKYAKGGSTTSKPPQPSAADRARSKAQLDSLKKAKPTAAEGKVAGSANRSEGPGYKKGGKAKGKSFAATKFGKALVKKSADTKGRAMKKFAKGGSIDGCAIKGKTKTSMVKMARGGAAKMRGRDSYGGAEFKNGGSC